MKNRRLSLTVQLILTMVGIVAGTVLLCWLFNTTLLGRYYTYQKQKELLKGYGKINQASRDDSLRASDFDITFETICANGNINMIIIDADGFLLRSSYSDAQRFQMQLDNLIYGAERGKVTVLAEGDGYVLQQQTDARLHSEFLVLWGSLDDGSYVYMRTPLESIRESVQISNRFFVEISLFAIGISIFVIVILSRGISKPIRALSAISRQMTRLDFEAKYQGRRGTSREIDELGRSVNELSEALEAAISKLKSANISLQQEIEKKEQIDEMRQEFLANVSHELKTPLALIRGYAEGLAECVNDDEESRAFYSDVIVDEADKMSQMVKKLLTLNQLEFGGEHVEMERFDITTLIEGLIQSSSLMISARNADIHFVHDGPVYVWGDIFMVEEVLTNYLTNALNHVDGERRIVFGITQGEGIVRVSVFNTGPQIPEEDLDKIWIKFYKVDKARTREYGGSGIGLSIVKAVMDSLQQKCGVINRENGVEFWMELENK